MGFKLGLEAKLYYDVAGAGQGTWVEIGNVRDLALNQETGESDVTTRANNGFRAMVATLIDGSIEWGMVWDTNDAAFTAIKEAFYRKNLLGKNLIGLAIMDGDITTSGSQGLIADFAITSFTRNENLEEALLVDVSAKPTFSSTVPDFVTIV